MAGRAWPAVPQVSFWSMRMVEWSMLALLVLAVGFWFARQAYVVKGQSELAAVRTTLGALRTAFILEHLRQAVRDPAVSVVPPQRNPFNLVQGRPANYRGVISPAQVMDVPAGQWFFEAVSECVGYRPFHSEWLDSPNGDSVVWYRVSQAPGPLQLNPLEPYRWQGQPLD
jgi:hypothetical protein